MRIDDLDTVRSKPEYIEDIFRTLEWLSLDWDEGPQSPDEQEHKYSQLLRADVYHEFIRQLSEHTKVFACSCARSEIQSQSPDGQYPGTCRDKGLDLQKPEKALRIETPANTVITVNDIKQGKVEIDLYKAIRDFVIRRRDGVPAYQIASLKDDLDFNINLIVRGEDLLPSTAAQIFMANVIGESSFAQSTFYHHGLLKDSEGNKLSKSAGSISIKAWREQGKKPEEFYLQLSQILELKEPATSLAQILELDFLVGVFG